MAEQAYAYVTLIPVAKGFQKEVAKQLGGVGGAGGKAGQVTGKNFSEGFGGQLKKLGLLAAGALATAGVGRLLGDSIKQASDLGESLNAVNVVFEESAAGIAKIGESASKSLGLSQTEFNQAAVQFSSFAQKIAGEGGDVVGTISDITQRGADFASVMNLEVSEALQVFQSGLAGETEPLKRFGIDLSAASVEAYALEAGIVDSGKAMTESQKVQARYGALLEQTAKTSGDFANTSDSLANRQRILQAEFTNLQASIGQALVPVMERLLGVVAERVLPAFEDFGNWLESPEGTAAVQGFTDVIVGLAEFLVNVTSAVIEQAPLLTALGIAYAATTVSVGGLTTGLNLATVAQKALNFAMRMNPIGMLITALGLAVVGVTAFMNANDAATPTQDELKQSIADTTKELEFYREEQGKTQNKKLYESTIRDLEDALRDQRAALQESYGWTQKQIEASYDSKDAMVANRIASEKLKPSLDNSKDGYNDLAFAATNAKLGVESLTIAEEAQRLMEEQSKLPDHLHTYKSYEEILAEVTAKTRFQTEEQVAFNETVKQTAIEMGLVVPGMDDASTSTSNYTGATQGATTAVEGYTTAVSEQADAIQSAIPINQEFLDVINGVADIDLAPSIADATREIQNMIIELDKANKLTRLEGGFVEFMQGGATVTAKFDPETGELLESFTDADLPNVTAVTGEVIDLNVLNDIVLRGEYSGAIQDLAGGAQNAINAVLGQVTLTNPETGRTKTIASSGDLTRAIEEAEAEGYVNGGGFEGDVNNIIGAIDDAANKIGSSVFPDAQLATGGLVTKPTRALIGEAGPEMVIPLNKFESMMANGGGGKSLVYNAAPNQSMDSEQELFTAMRRAKVVANW